MAQRGGHGGGAEPRQPHLEPSLIVGCWIEVMTLWKGAVLAAVAGLLLLWAWQLAQCG